MSMEEKKMTVSDGLTIVLTSVEGLVRCLEEEFIVSVKAEAKTGGYLSVLKNETSNEWTATVTVPSRSKNKE